ncbi:MAG: hypothetical protein QM527_10560 [Alphaproteobacteria bacterium]|nr:hypothetical protein [Alphaproteobacteria bacterium]
MTWFESLTGCSEQSVQQVRANLHVQGPWLHSRINGVMWHAGHLSTPSLAELRAQVSLLPHLNQANRVREVVANVQHLHADPAHAQALFQVASQFNLLEMVGPNVTPERGIGIYEHDRTQGPACAIAAGAGTIYRNYFVPLGDQLGQTADRQIDTLADLGALLGNDTQKLWRMTNGYVLPSADGLKAIDLRLAESDHAELDRLRASLRVGLHADTQVTLTEGGHRVSQIYASALPVAYSPHPKRWWARFAQLVLEAAYEATLCAGILNAQKTGQRKVFLTPLGGGAFGNETDWIIGAIKRALRVSQGHALDVAVVSYGRSQPAVRQLLDSVALDD